MLSNSWHRLTDVQWLVMLLLIIGSSVLMVFLERLAKTGPSPIRRSKWSDWRRMK